MPKDEMICEDCGSEDAHDDWENYEGTPLCCDCVSWRTQKAPLGYSIED